MTANNQAEFERLMQVLDGLLYKSENNNSGLLKRVGISKTMYSVLERTLAEEVEEANKEWIGAVRRGLGDDLPSRLRKKKRTPQARRFPYRVDGDLYNSIRTDATASIQGYKINFKSWVQFESLHSILTSEGFTRKGKGTSNGKWVGWLDRVLHSRHKLSDYHGGHFFSFDRMLENLYSGKRLQSMITAYFKTHRGKG